MSNYGINRKYKDRLFTFIFGREENKAWTLSLYNAVNHTDYKDPELIQINTIEDVLYMGMHNDVSFITDMQMNMYEQQSSFNPNMPLRMLQYAAGLYEKYLRQNKLNKYSSKRLELPVPRLVVFFNGREELEDEMILRLSDSYPKCTPRCTDKSDIDSSGIGKNNIDRSDFDRSNIDRSNIDTGDIEVIVHMININAGHSVSILEKCPVLREYMWLIDFIRDNAPEYGIETAVNQSLAEMPERFMIRDFLAAHKAEVVEMLLTEYDVEETMEMFKRDAKEEGRTEGRAEGLAEGFSEGRLKTLLELMNKGIISASDAADHLKISTEEFLQRIRMLNQ